MLKVLAQARARQIMRRDSRICFDETYYLSQAPMARAFPGGPWQHFLRIGAFRGFDPHPAFSVAFYRRQGGTRSLGRLDPLTHYCEHGARAGLDPHPLLQTRRYQHTAGLSADENPLVHMAVDPCNRAASPNPLFEQGWYLHRAPDVLAAGMNPLVHYLRYGWREGRETSPYFSPALYGRMHPDVAAAQVDPLYHYLIAGARERRRPHPLFDVDWYAFALSREPVAPHDLYFHFINHGDAERRSPHPLFDPVFYHTHYPDVARSGLPPLRHYIEIGGRLGRATSAVFDGAHFLSHRSDVIASGEIPLTAYVLSDAAGQQHPHPLFDTAHDRAVFPWLQAGTDALVDYRHTRAAPTSPTRLRSGAGIPCPTRALLRPKSERARAAMAADAPLVSVLVPCWQSDPRLLQIAVDSVRTQTWTNWELVLVDDGSPSPEVARTLERLAAIDGRIRWTRCETNGGISAATNVALKMCTGEFVALLDHDDALAPDALERLMHALLEADADAVYSDQAYVDDLGTIIRPFRKPAWSPVLLTGVMYVGHLLLVRTALAREVGGFDSSFDRCQDFEFMLRIGERARAVAHVPEILYHWRMVAGSVASAADAKGALEPLQAKAVNAHFRRTGLPAEARPHPLHAHRLQIHPTPRRSLPPFMAIVNGTGDGTRLGQLADALGARGCIGLFGVDGAPPPWRTVGAATATAAARRVLDGTAAPFVLFVDPAVVFTDKLWLENLLLYAERPDVAFATATLRDARGLVCAAGLTPDPEVGLRPLHSGDSAESDGFAGSISCDREVTAVHAGLTLIATERLAALGELPADYLGLNVAIGALSLRAEAAGLRNVTVARPIARLAPGAQPERPEDRLDRLLFVEAHPDLPTLDRRRLSESFDA